MVMKKVLVITDNEFLHEAFRNILIELKQDLKDFEFHFRFSFRNKLFVDRYKGDNNFKPIHINEELSMIIKNYHMVFSLHCKQIFPAELVKSVKCINVHPGLNPFNRGWFPQVFSIINGLPAGATIHEIDEHLDHGPVIVQKQIEILSHDTSLTAYNKILEAEIEMLRSNLIKILNSQYQVSVKEEGNLNLKADFNKLCHLDLQNNDSLQNHLNLLRALTHGNYANAYFLNEKGKRVFVKIEFKIEE